MLVHFLTSSDAPIICESLHKPVLDKEKSAIFEKGHRSNLFSTEFLNRTIQILKQHNWSCLIRSLQIRKKAMDSTAEFCAASFKRNFSILNAATSAYDFHDFLLMAAALRMQIDTLSRVSIALWAQGCDAEVIYKNHISSGLQFRCPFGDPIPDSLLLERAIREQPSFDLSQAYKSACSAIHATAHSFTSPNMGFSFSFEEQGGPCIIDHKDPVLQMDYELIPFKNYQEVMRLLIMTVLRTIAISSYFISLEYDTIYGQHEYSRDMNIAIKANSEWVDHFAQSGIIPHGQEWIRFLDTPDNLRDPLWYFE